VENDALYLTAPGNIKLTWLKKQFQNNREFYVGLHGYIHGGFVASSLLPQAFPSLHIFVFQDDENRF
jgi:hypothetical protein